MYVCMYVGTGPVVGAARGSRLQPDAHRRLTTSLATRVGTPGGHGDRMGVPRRPSQPRGDTYPYVYIYIYMSESLSVCSLAAKHRRLRSATLSERGSTPVILSGVAVLPLALPATCRAAAAFAACRLRRSGAILSLSLSLSLLLSCRLHQVGCRNSTPSHHPPGAPLHRGGSPFPAYRASSVATLGGVPSRGAQTQHRT